MSAISKTIFKKALAQAVYNELLTKSARYFFYMGKVLPWDETDTLETPVDTYSYEINSRSNIVYTKQLTINDLCFVIRRIDWVTGTIYDMYDDSVTSLETTDFYVKTDEHNVYKCIFNNNGAASTVKPTGNDATSQTYADGYVWKFMYNLPVALRNKFMTADYLPVMTALNNQFYSNGGVESVTIENGGSGYTTATAVVAGNGGGVSLTPVINSGSITSCVVDTPGSGYTLANINVTGDGSGASLLANLSVGDINTLQANIELQAVNGALEAIKVTAGGTGYTTAPVTIVGDGSGAVATATISSGAIIKVAMTNVGSGYTWATITIGGDGTGATARAIISPKGGHGKNAVDEFFAKDLMFSTTISSETSQGLAITNDLRQTGIIKNLASFGSSVRYRSSTGSACYKISATVDTTKFPKDEIIFQGVDNKRFLIVESTSTSLLLQPLDDLLPNDGLVYKNASNDEITTTAVVAPTIDKFSGDLLYINNKTAFTPTSSQAISFRTILTF
jgi:hypothetical protein